MATPVTYTVANSSCGMLTSELLIKWSYICAYREAIVGAIYVEGSYVGTTRWLAPARPIIRVGLTIMFLFNA